MPTAKPVPASSTRPRPVAAAPSYRVLGWVTAALFFYLFAAALFTPRNFLGDLGIDLNESVFFLCRRGAVLLLGISVLAFLARNSPHSPARQAILLSIALSMTALAALGVFELLRGVVNRAILFPVSVESTVAVAHLLLWFACRRASAATTAAAGQT